PALPDMMSASPPSRPASDAVRGVPGFRPGGTKNEQRLPECASMLQQVIADRADLLHAGAQLLLGAAHVGDGGLQLLHALVQLVGRGVGVDQATGQLLDGALDLLLEDAV